MFSLIIMGGGGLYRWNPVCVTHSIYKGGVKARQGVFIKWVCIS